MDPSYLIEYESLGAIREGVVEIMPFAATEMDLEKL